jgi:hypothetical protein
LQKAKDRVRSFERRDEEKIRTDKAKNDFESVIYSFRDFLNEDDNLPYIPEGEVDETRSKLTTEEDWLLDGEGENAGAFEYS